MLRTIDLRGRTLSLARAAWRPCPAPRPPAKRRSRRPRSSSPTSPRDGEAALREQAERFDGVTGHDIRVPAAHLDEALATVDPAVRAALEAAIERVRAASAAQVPAPRRDRARPWRARAPALAAGAARRAVRAGRQGGLPVERRHERRARAGRRGRAGRARLAAAARRTAAACTRRSSPPRGCSASTRSTRWAARARSAPSRTAWPSLGLDPVDVVTGPGNNFVASAKRAVAGVVGTDSEAGATEILVVADADADPRLIAADLISQAEHDEQASAVLVTDSEALADAVAAEIARRAARTRHARPRRGRPGRAPVRDRARRRPRPRRPRSATPTRPSTSSCTSPTRDPEDFVHAGAVFVGTRLAGEPRRLPRRQQPRAAHGRAGALQRRASARRSCARSR